MTKHRQFFSMALNVNKEIDSQVLDILQNCTTHNKCDYVKSAIIAYAQKEELKDILCDVLSQYNIIHTEKNEHPKNTAYKQSKALNDHEEKTEKSTTTTKNNMSKKAKNFMSSLQAD